MDREAPAGFHQIPPPALIRAEVVPYRLPLQRAWIAAAATLTERRGALLRLTDAEGFVGWGDCAPLPSGGNAAAVLAALEAYACRPGSADFEYLPAEVRWAVETAQCDIAAQRRGLPLARFLNPEAPLDIASNAALGPLDDACATRAIEARQAGYALGKIKVGIGPVDAELECLRAVAAASGLRLRLDANRAWSDDEAARFLHAIAPLPIDAVEEPLAAPTPEKLARLQAGLPYALAVDESLPQLGSTALIDAHAVRRLVLKPARLGLQASQAVARQARAAGLEVVITAVVDSAIGVTAAAHLAAALAPERAHGLGTGAWLAADVAAAPPIIGGRLHLPHLPGLGIHPR